MLQTPHLLQVMEAVALPLVVACNRSLLQVLVQAQADVVSMISELHTPVVILPVLEF